MEQPQLGKLTNTLLLLFYVLIFIVALCFALHYVIFTRTVQRWKRSNIPFLRPMFLLGHKYFLDLGKCSAAVPINRIYRENEDKDLVALFMLTTPVIMLRDPKLIHQVFVKNFDKAHQNGFTVLEDDVESQSLIVLASDKKEWKNARTIMAPMFRTSKLHGDAEFAKIQKQVDKLLKFAEKAEFEGQPLDVDEATTNFLVDAISLLGFSKDMDSFQEKGALYGVVRALSAPSYLTMVKFLIVTHFPALQVFDSFRFVNNKMKDVFKNLLTEEMEQRNGQDLSHDDLIDHFISLKQKEFARLSLENSNDLLQMNEALNIRRLIGYSLSLLAPGALPPAIAAAYCLHLLSLHPEYQERVKKEIDRVMKENQVTEFTSEVVKNLQFTDQCVLESERLYPSFPFLIRRCSDDIQIPGASFTLKKGDNVFLSQYSMHRDPKYFNDPDRFYPERFSPENRGSFSSETFYAFGYGPKKCPAYRQGNFLAVTCVAALIDKYEIRPHSHFKQMDATDFDPRSSLNHHKGVLLVKLIPRKIASTEI